MSERPACPTCRAPLPVRAPLGLCPSCLMRQGFDDIPPDVGGPASRGLPRDLPGAGRGSTVLESLSATIGLIPRVLLRDPDLKAADPGPVVRPSSPEMPGPAGRPARLHLYGEIARGGMGAVLKGRDPDLGRDLAVKVLLDEHRESPDMVRRFVEEAQIGGQLQHPGVVPVYELGAFADSRPYFSMKLVKGSTLAEMLAGRRRDGRPAAVPRDLRAGGADGRLCPFARRDPPRHEALERDGGGLRRGPGDGLGADEGPAARRGDRRPHGGPAPEA